MKGTGLQIPIEKLQSNDDIQIWVYRNFLNVLREVFPDKRIDGSLPLNLKLEYPITGGYQNSQMIGFVDIYCPQFGIAVEVKTEIPVIGDLIRQVQFYRTYMSGPYWIVVSPDDRPAMILREQGIYFYKFQTP